MLSSFSLAMPGWFTGRGPSRKGLGGTPFMRIDEVALVGVVDCGVLLVVPPLQLHCRMVDGWLEVAVLGVNHHPHIGLHATKALYQGTCTTQEHDTILGESSRSF